MFLGRARRGLVVGATGLSFLIVVLAGVALAQKATSQTTQHNPYFTTQTFVAPDGTSLERIVINGPPTPPPGYELERMAVALPEPNPEAGVNTLTVPAYEWTFGCSATSGSMIAGYYDRNSFPSMYTGPTNSGVAPLDDSSWPTWVDGAGKTYHQCPLAASHNGLDGRVTKGSIDDYWVSYLGGVTDPYITGAWYPHPWGDAIGDYMYTSQSAVGNDDGSTSFYYTSSAAQLPCSTLESSGSPYTHDGNYGREVFYRAKGYTVTDCYTQQTDNVVTGGFSFAQYMAEIDAGRPVMLQLEGHTIVGVGYNTSANTVYLHDTWDTATHSMTWGGSYSGMSMWGASIVNLAPAGSTYYALTPCRVVDTRSSIDPAAVKRGTFTNGEIRAYTFSTSTDCSGLSSTAKAWVIHLSFQPLSQASYLIAYPDGATRPLASTILGYPNKWTGDNAVISAGSGGTIDLYSQYAGDVIIDVNGYFQ